MAHKTVIGKELINMLMFSIYSDNRAVYREYVQNASDSIHLAIEQGIIAADEAHITISIEKYASKIEITDNGTGIPSNDAERVLKDIANSQKSGQNNQAGQFGIGRLSGGGYCKKLTFKTSAKGEDVATMIVFDVESIREIINDKNDNSEAAEIIDLCTKVHVSPEDVDKHYFTVTLTDILPEYAPVILEQEKISAYLEEVAPISFNVSFKNILNNDIESEENVEIKPYYDQLSCIKLTVNDNNDLRKKYSRKVQTKSGKDGIERIRFVKFSDPDFGDLAWGWVAITPFTEAISTAEESAVVGIRLRLHNILIGGKSYFDGTSYFKQARSNNYFIGEIHVINDKITPTPQRDNLAPSPQENRLREKIQNFFRDELEKIYQDANKLKTTLKKFDNKEITFFELKDEHDKKNNNRYKNLWGYKYLLDIYNPKFDEIFAKHTPANPPIAEPTHQPDNQPTTPPSTTTTITTTVQEPTINFGDTTTDNPPTNPPTPPQDITEQPGNVQPQPPVNIPKPVDKKLEKIEKQIGSDKKDVVEEIIKIIDDNFISNRHKEAVSKTAKRIKDLILSELSKKK